MQADLLDPPGAWLRAFDLAIEIITAQALPDPPRRTAIVNAGRLVAPGGTLLTVQRRRTETDDGAGPPWALRREEIEAYATDGLVATAIGTTADPARPDFPVWRAEFRRPEAAS